MFLGTYKTTFSGVGRVILPKKMRSELTDSQVVLTKGLDGCVWGFGKVEWERQAAEQLRIPLTEERGRRIRRYIFSEAELADLDRQGRFVVPTGLLTYAEIKKDILIVGAGDHFEIWNVSRFEKLDLQNALKET